MDTTLNPQGADPKVIKLSERVVVAVLEFSEHTLEEYPLPRLIHVRDASLAMPIAPMIMWALTKRSTARSGPWDHP